MSHLGSGEKHGYDQGAAPVDRWRYIEYDVWGNEDDGFEINNQFRTNIFVNLPRGAPNSTIIRILKREGIIRGEARSADINIEGDEDIMYFEWLPTGRPEFALMLDDEEEDDDLDDDEDEDED